MSARARLLGLLALALLMAACDAAPETGQVEAPPTPTPGTPAPPPEPDPPPPEPDDDLDPQPERDPALQPVDAYAVSAGHPDAVEAGMSVLADGGNAVDAAIATAYAISVVEPFASGIGGGGSALVAELGRDTVAYDYREVVSASGQIPASNTGVPGFVAGMEALHAAHGTTDLDELLAPAVALAENATTSDMLAAVLRSGADKVPVGSLPHLYPGGVALSSGDPLVQEELATTLGTISEGGAAAFYDGELAQALAATVDGLDAQSLADYEVQKGEPVTGSFAGYEIVGAKPPLPGVSLVQALQIAETLGVADHDPASADFVHTIAMSWRVADHFMRWHLGDPAFVDVPLDELTDGNRNAALADQISMDGVLRIDAGARGGGLDGNTTHLTVVDAGGMVVSMTNTLTNFWGSGQYTLGFFMNDQLVRFGLGQGDANAPEAGKRSVTWSLPALVLDGEGRPVLALGTPGGERIPMVLTHALARWAAHGEPLSDVVAAPRFHLDGHALAFEELPPGEVADALRDRGYTDLFVPDFPFYFGSLQALEVDYERGEIRGAADTRREAEWRVEAR